MNRLDEYDAVQSVHERDGKSKIVAQQKIDRAVPSKNQLHSNRTHERRHDQRNESKALDKDRTREVETGRDVRQRQCDDRGDNDRHRGDIERIPETLAKQRCGEEVGKVLQRCCTCCRILEGYKNHLCHRYDQ